MHVNIDERSYELVDSIHGEHSYAAVTQSLVRLTTFHILQKSWGASIPLYDVPFMILSIAKFSGDGISLGAVSLFPGSDIFCC
jgi:hypothetical protein